jgi:hypothetical protein
MPDTKAAATLNTRLLPLRKPYTVNERLIGNGAAHNVRGVISCLYGYRDADRRGRAVENRTGVREGPEPFIVKWKQFDGSGFSFWQGKDRSAI